MQHSSFSKCNVDLLRTRFPHVSEFDNQRFWRFHQIFLISVEKINFTVLCTFSSSAHTISMLYFDVKPLHPLFLPSLKNFCQRDFLILDGFLYVSHRRNSTLFQDEKHAKRQEESENIDDRKAILPHWH